MIRPPCVASVARTVVILSLTTALSLACSTDAAPPETLVAAPLASCLQGGDANLTCEAPSNPNKVRVCHSTGSAPNRYVMIEVNANALGNAHVIGEVHGRNQLPDLLPGTGGLNCNCQPIECTNLCAGAADGTSCQDDPCDEVGACQGGVCVSQPKNCSGAGDLCNVSLNACANGVCLTAPKTAGTSCADADLCDGVETCDGSGSCAPGTPVAIDDGDICTTDACDSATGVSHTPIAVDDGVDCTIDFCDPEDGASRFAYDLGCFDGDPNSVDTCDLQQGCVYSCRAGTVLSTASGRCEDECLTSTPTCHPNATAVASCQTQDCRCKPGYEGDGFTFCGDIDECLRGSLCGPDRECVNTTGSYRCDCGAGFAEVAGVCVDVDECLQDALCGAGTVCTNTYGGYTCAVVPSSGVQAYDCSQDPNCRDCSSALFDDGLGLGSGDCQECEPGYVFVTVVYNGIMENVCVDVDECLEADVPLVAYEGQSATQPLVCVNMQGGFRWECQAGFTLDTQGVDPICRDIDECASVSTCGAAKPCTNTPGGYACACPEGYADDGARCVDVDECARGIDICDPSASCINETGSYACVCAAGATCVACNAGFADCNGRVTDGCEADLNAKTSCGACGNACTAGQECVAGRCGLFASSGADGPFAPGGDIALAPGVHHFTTIAIPAGVTVTTYGSGVLDLRATGAVLIDGVIDVSGGDGRIANTDNCQAARNGAGGNTGYRGIGLQYEDPSGRLWAASGGGGSGFHHPTEQYHSWNTASGPTSIYIGARFGGGRGARACSPQVGITSPFKSHGGGGYAGGGGQVPGATEQFVPATGNLGGDYLVRTVGGTIAACVTADYSGCDGQYYPPSGANGYGGGGGAIGPLARSDLPVRKTFRPGSGGGGGDAANTYTANGGGGGGGGGGGALRIASAVSITLGSSGRLLANGGAGGNGGDGCGGAGGGGSGGVIYLHAPALAISGDVEARGGLGGTGGVDPMSVVCGGNGGRGGLGRIRLSVDPDHCALAGDFDPPLASGCGASPESGAPGFVYVKHGEACDVGGGFCQLEVSPCEDDPCDNGATCVDLEGSYRCDCVPGYTGQHCETNIDECAAAPCVNGTCVDGVNRYTCVCDEGWAGATCAHEEVCGNGVVDSGEACEGTWPDGTVGAICLADCQRGQVSRQVIAAGQATYDTAIVAWYDVRLTMNGAAVPISDFDVLARRAFPASPPASPNDVAGTVTDNGDGTYRVAFTFDEPGFYLDDWVVDDQPAHLVPHRFDAFPATCGNGVVDHAFESCDSAAPDCFQCQELPFSPALTTAVGAGLTSAQVGVPALFTLIVKDASGAPVTTSVGCPFQVVITGTSVILPELLPQSDPAYCSYIYTPTTAGAHVLDIMFGPSVVAGSPYALVF